MEVLFLGTGTSHGVPMIGCRCPVCLSPDPRDKRTRPSILVTLDSGARVLVDTSTDLRAQALAHGVDRIDAVIYTHSHADHVFGFDEIRRFNHLSRQVVPVFADARTLADLRRTFSYAFDPSTPKGGGLPQVAPVEIHGPFDVAGIEVAPVPIVHGHRTILGYRFGAFAYLTDCGGIPEPSYDLLHGLDVVVIGALRHRPHPTHFTVAEAAAAAARIGARRTFFTHMCHDLGHASTEAQLAPGLALAYDGLALTISPVGA